MIDWEALGKLLFVFAILGVCFGLPPGCVPEEPGKPGKPEPVLEAPAPVEAEVTYDIPPLRFSYPQNSSVAAVAGAGATALVFYDVGLEVGRLTWTDLDGDGDAELRWAGCDVAASAQVLIDFMMASERLCPCP